MNINILMTVYHLFCKAVTPLEPFLLFHSCANSRGYSTIYLTKITSLASTYTETKSSVWSRAWIVRPTKKLAHCLALTLGKGHALIPAASSILWP